MTDTPANTWGDAEMIADLKLDEGTKLTLYHDSRGFQTIGTGRNIQVNGVSPAEADFMLANDIAHAAADLDAHASWWRTLDAPKQRVMLNLTFNMGWRKFSAFGTFLGLMQSGAYAEAAADLQTTAWFGEVGQRGPRMIERLAEEPAA